MLKGLKDVKRAQACLTFFKIPKGGIHEKIISALTAFIIAATGCAMAGCGGGPATSDTPVLLTVEQYPDTVYDVGEQFSAEGGVLALHYGGGVSQEISMTAEGVSLSTVDTSAAGSQTVTVTYGGLSTSFVVYVGEMEAATDTPSDPGTDPGGDEDKTVLRITVASNPTVTEFCRRYRRLFGRYAQRSIYRRHLFAHIFRRRGRHAQQCRYVYGGRQDRNSYIRAQKGYVQHNRARRRGRGHFRGLRRQRL